MLKTRVQFPAGPPFLCIPFLFLLFIVVDSYIDLLEEAGNLLYEIFHSADDSVADYKLDVEIAYTFVRKALDTEDRLDIFRALQKVHDVLETDGEEPVGGDLVDRIKNALEGLREQKNMKNKVKEIITEAVLGFLNESTREEKSKDKKEPDTSFDENVKKKFLKAIQTKDR